MTLEQEPLPPATDGPTPTADTPSPRTARKAFFGPFGLRAGWGLLLYIAIVAAFVFAGRSAVRAMKGKPTQNAAVSQSKSPTQPSAHPATPVKKEETGEHAKSVLLGEGSAFICLALAALCLAKIERRDFGVYGIGRRRLLDFFPGAFSGLAVLSLLVLTLRSLHVLVFDARILSGRAVLSSGLAWLVAFFLVGAFEEYLFRGYLQYTLTRGLFRLAARIAPTHSRGVAFLLASIVTSLLFFKAHTGNGGENALGLITVFLAGIVLTYALWRTGSLWWGLGFHTTWDWAQSFLYGVPDSGQLSLGRLFQTHAVGNPVLSGGSDGPEGSVLVIPALLIILLILRFTPVGPQPALEPHSPRPLSLPEGADVVA